MSYIHGLIAYGKLLTAKMALTSSRAEPAQRFPHESVDKSSERNQGLTRCTNLVG